MKVYASNTNDRTEYDKYYYEKNKDVIKERNRKYKETTNYKSTPEQRKEEEKVRPS